MSNRQTSIAEITALMSGITILSSIMYEWFYYMVVGSDLIVFLVAADFINLAISWFPGVVLIGVVYSICEFLMMGIEGGRSEEELIAGSPNPNFTKWFRKSPEYILGITLFIGGWFQYLFVPGASYTYIGISLIVAWYVLSNRILGMPRVAKKFTLRVRSVIIIFPIFAIIFASQGASDAQKDLRKKSGEYSIVTQDKIEVNNAQILRSIQVGILVRIPSDERLELIPWSHVKGLYKDGSPTDPRSPMCRWLGWACIQ